MIAYITELNENIYNSFISEGLVLVFVYSNWSELSKLTSPIVDEISSEYVSNVKVGRLDVDVFIPNVEFRDVPTFILYKDGNVLDVLTGFEDKNKLIEFFNIHI